MPLMRLVLQQILARLTEKLDAEAGIAKRRQLLLMLDEFPQFGKLPFFEKALAYSMGFNIRSFLISQDLTQINQAYGKEHAIFSNCGIQIAYTPNHLATAKHLSEVIGTTTLNNTRRSLSSAYLSPIMDRMTLLQNEIKRPLMTADELLRFDKDRSLIFMNGMAPILGNKIRYFEDQFLAEKAAIKAPLQSDRFEVVLQWTYVKPMTEESLLPELPDQITTPSISKPKFSKKTLLAMSEAEFSELFLNGIRHAYLNNKKAVNQLGSILHRVENGLLIAADPAVELFLQENSVLAKYSDKVITKLSKPQALGKIRYFYWGDWADRQKVSGFVIDPAKIIEDKWPDVNSQLQLDVTNE